MSPSELHCDEHESIRFTSGRFGGRFPPHAVIRLPRRNGRKKDVLLASDFLRVSRSSFQSKRPRVRRTSVSRRPAPPSHLRAASASRGEWVRLATRATKDDAGHGRPMVSHALRQRQTAAHNHSHSRGTPPPRHGRGSFRRSRTRHRAQERKGDRRRRLRQRLAASPAAAVAHLAPAAPPPPPPPPRDTLLRRL